MFAQRNHLLQAHCLRASAQRSMAAMTFSGNKLAAFNTANMGLPDAGMGRDAAIEVIIKPSFVKGMLTENADAEAPAFNFDFDGMTSKQLTGMLQHADTSVPIRNKQSVRAWQAVAIRGAAPHLVCVGPSPIHRPCVQRWDLRHGQSKPRWRRR